MFAAGMFEHMVLFTGSTVKVPGAAPKLHINVAPETTKLAIWDPLYHYLTQLRAG
jgi:hypothetical protein